jgi:hypothetical protein
LSLKCFKFFSESFGFIFVFLGGLFRVHDLLFQILNFLGELSLNILQVLLHRLQVGFQVILLCLLMLIDILQALQLLLVLGFGFFKLLVFLLDQIFFLLDLLALLLYLFMHRLAFQFLISLVLLHVFLKFRLQHFYVVNFGLLLL